MEIIFVWLFFALLCAVVANTKGRSTFGWFLLGCFLGIIALLIVLVAPSLKVGPVLAGSEVATEKTHVRCPDCKELVRKDARKCKHCGIGLIPQT